MFNLYLIFLGHQFEELKECIRWMAPYSYIIDIQKPVVLKTFNGVEPQEWHSIQTVEVSKQMLVSDYFVYYI